MARPQLKIKRSLRLIWADDRVVRFWISSKLYEQFLKADLTESLQKKRYIRLISEQDEAMQLHVLRISSDIHSTFRRCCSLEMCFIFA